MQFVDGVDRVGEEVTVLAARSWFESLEQAVMLAAEPKVMPYGQREACHAELRRVVRRLATTGLGIWE